MKRTHVLFSVIVSVTALLTSGLTAVLAAPTVPSWEILSVDAENTCQNGIVWFNSDVNHVGHGSVFGWVGRDGVGNEASWGLVDFSLIPSGPQVNQFNIPGTYADNTIFYFELVTYSEANQGGQATYKSRIYFNCTTGEQVGPVQNTVYVNLRRIDVPVVGPAFEHPGDIVSNPGLLHQLDLPQYNPEQLTRQLGG